MNVGGVLNTCKSNEEDYVLVHEPLSGERVSNALVTCPAEGDNRSKGLLIPHVLSRIRSLLSKGLAS